MDSSCDINAAEPDLIIDSLITELEAATLGGKSDYSGLGTEGVSPLSLLEPGMERESDGGRDGEVGLGMLLDIRFA